MSVPQGNLFLITGNDKDQIFAEASRLFVAFAGEDPDPFAVDILSEGDDGPSAAIINNALLSLQSPSFLGGNKVVWLKHTSAFQLEGDGKNHPGEDRAFQQLAAFLKNGLPDDMIFIMDGPDADGRKALSKACKAKGTLIVLDKPDMSKKGWEETMRGCIRREAELKGVTLEFQAMDFLLEVLGTDVGRIPQELEKIICYRGTTEGTATLQEVQQVCEGKGEELAWALGNMLGERNVREALKVVDTLITQNKENDQYARSMLLSAAGFFRSSIRLRVFMQENKIKNPVALRNFVQGMSPEAKQKALENGMDFVNFHPFRIQMLASQSEKYTPQELIKAIRIIRDAVWQSVSSATSPRVTLENALLQIIGIGSRGAW